MFKKIIGIGFLSIALFFIVPTIHAAPPSDPPAPTEEEMCKVVNDTRAHRDVHFANKSAKGYRIPDPLATSSSAWKQFISATAERTSLPVETVDWIWILDIDLCYTLPCDPVAL